MTEEKVHLHWLTKLLAETESYWRLKPKTFFHHAIAQYLTKKIKFRAGQKIREKMYGVLGDPYDQKIFDNTSDSALLSCGLDDEQVKTLRKISLAVISCDSDEKNVSRLGTITGIGDWTCKSIFLMKESRGWEVIMLKQDYYIRQRLFEMKVAPMQLVKGRRVPTEASTERDFRACCTSPEQFGPFSRFLWRITRSGTAKLAKDKFATLTRDDFL